jgi:hypothetical protein
MYLYTYHKVLMYLYTYHKVVGLALVVMSVFIEIAFN